MSASRSKTSVILCCSRLSRVSERKSRDLGTCQTETKFFLKKTLIFLQTHFFAGRLTRNASVGFVYVLGSGLWFSVVLPLYLCLRVCIASCSNRSSGSARLQIEAMELPTRRDYFLSSSVCLFSLCVRGVQRRSERNPNVEGKRSFVPSI